MSQTTLNNNSINNNSTKSLRQNSSQQELFKSSSSQNNLRDSQTSLRPGSAMDRKDNLFNNNMKINKSITKTSSRPQSGKETIGSLNNNNNNNNNNSNINNNNRPPSHKHSYKNIRPISAISHNSRFDQFNHSSAVSLTNINERSEFINENSNIKFDDDKLEDL